MPMWDYGVKFTDVVLDVRRPARKQYICGECDREIPRGEMYVRERTVQDGRFTTYVTCPHCVTVSRRWVLEGRGMYHWNHVAQELHGFDDDQSRALWQAMRCQWRHLTTGDLIALPETEDLNALVKYVCGIYPIDLDLVYVLEVAPGLYVPNTQKVGRCKPQSLAELNPRYRYSWGGYIADAVRKLYPGAVFVTLVGGKVAPWSRRAPWAGSNHGETVHTAGITLEAK